MEIRQNWLDMRKKWHQYSFIINPLQKKCKNIFAQNLLIDKTTHTVCRSVHTFLIINPKSPRNCSYFNQPDVSLKNKEAQRYVTVVFIIYSHHSVVLNTVIYV